MLVKRKCYVCCMVGVGQCLSEKQREQLATTGKIADHGEKTGKAWYPEDIRLYPH